MPRVDKISPVEKIPEYYSDFSIGFDRNPVTGEMVRLTNADSVKESVKNIILTNVGERFYQSILGSKVRASLFENLDDITINQLEDTIRNAILNCEPRANIINVNVISFEENNAIQIAVEFSLINISGTQIVTVVQRAR